MTRRSASAAPSLALWRLQVCLLAAAGCQDFIDSAGRRRQDLIACLKQLAQVFLGPACA